MVSELPPSDFRQRFAVARFQNSGVIVDTVTGTYFRLNASAATICEILENTPDVETAIGQVARQQKSSRELAAEQIRSVLASLVVSAPRKSPSEATLYEPSSDGGYDLCLEGRPILRVDAEGRLVTLVSRPQSPTLTIRDFLRNLGPRIAFLRGLIVLHGSAVRDGRGAVAMCGASEAGKTTTARLLSRHGRELLAEDLVVASSREGRVYVFKEGEHHINAWATATARAFESGEVTAATTESLMALENGATVSLDSIWFMDASRRTDSDSISNRSLPPAEALLRVLSNSFVGSANWRRFLEVSRLVVAASLAYETSVPNSLTRLEDAIANQRVNSAS